MPNTPKTLTEKALLAMPAKSYMNAAQLDFFRELLRKQRQDLIDNASMTIDHLRDGEAEADPNDRATIEEENSIELRIRDRERKMLPRVEAALKRIETGQFGYCEETGEPMSRYFIPPHTPEDLEKRLQMIGQSIRLTGGLPFGKDIGTDAMYAIMTAAQQMGKPEYLERARNYLEHLRKHDLNLCGAITDVKGDRGKTPSQQAHPDYYVHVVDQNDEGIVVRGAKIHITGAPVANDILVLPTRQMRENEAEYSVAFAVPANAKGISMVCRPSGGERGP